LEVNRDLPALRGERLVRLERVGKMEPISVSLTLQDRILRLNEERIMRSIALKTTAIAALMTSVFAYAQTEVEGQYEDVQTQTEAIEMATPVSETESSDPVQKESWENADPVEDNPADTIDPAMDAVPDASPMMDPISEPVTDEYSEQMAEPVDGTSNELDPERDVSSASEAESAIVVSPE